MDKHVLSVLVRNHSGVLSRVAGLFSRRGYNIESLSVGVTEDTEVSRITIVVNADEQILEQIKKQLNKLVEVLKVIELHPQSSILRELALIKVSAGEQSRASIIEIVDIFRAKIVDVGTESLVVEITGDQNKIEPFVTLLKPYGIKEIVRTGVTALERGNKEMKQYKKYEEES